MNFDLDDDTKALQDDARRFLQGRSGAASARRAIDTRSGHDGALWERIVAQGWVGAAMPEKFGGSAMGYESLCMLAHELGYSISAVPFSSSAYFVLEAIAAFGSDEMRERYLPALIEGRLIGTFALAEGFGNPSPDLVRAEVASGTLSGTKLPVMDGSIADIAIVVARGEGRSPGLHLVELGGPGVTRTALDTVDPSRGHAKLDFARVPALALEGGTGWDSVTALLDRAAILLAFEQIGGAQACLEMARDHARERYAFGRPIGSFQAVKHRLADIYVATEIARSNAYFAAWALTNGAAELPVAAAAARIAATDAFGRAAQDNIHVHGGMGFTWELDCHLYHRRAKLLALAVGSAPYWKDQLVSRLQARNA